MPSTPLPSLVPKHVQDKTSVSAYDMLLQLEKTILADIDSAPSKCASEEAERSLMYCRIIGHFFHHVPTNRGLNNLVLQVCSSEGDKQKLIDLGKMYYDHALRAVFRTRSFKQQTPVQSPFSRQSFNNLEDLIKAKIEEAPLSYQTAKKTGLANQYPKVVTLTSTDPVRLPLPSRDYLALHAACAKVAQLSAAAEYLDRMFKDMEEMMELSSDGTSAAVLEHAIWAAQHTAQTYFCSAFLGGGEVRSIE